MFTPGGGQVRHGKESIAVVGRRGRHLTQLHHFVRAGSPGQ